MVGDAQIVVIVALRLDIGVGIGRQLVGGALEQGDVRGRDQLQLGRREIPREAAVQGSGVIQGVYRIQTRTQLIST